MLMIFTVFNDTSSVAAAALGVLSGFWGAFAAGQAENVTFGWVADWEKACRNMVLGTVRNTAESVGTRCGEGRVANEVVGAAASRTLPGRHGPRRDCFLHRSRGGRDGRPMRPRNPRRDRRRRQPPGRSRNHPLLFPAQRRANASTATRSTRRSRRSTRPACSRTCASTSPGGRLVVTVVENPVINRVAFEGNNKLKDDQLANEVQSKPRGTLSRPTVQADVQRIVEIYRRNGRFDVRVEPKIIELPNNRVDLVFEIKEGEKTGVKKIIFVGNKAYRDQRLKDEIKTNETSWFWVLAFFQSADIYDPDRIEADRDLIRRFYLKHGYADVRVVSAVSVYDPAKKGFIVTFTIDEGARYRFGKIDIQSNVPQVDPKALYGRAQGRRRRRLQRRGGREVGREHVDRSGPPRLSVRRGPSARRPRSADPHHQRHVHGRGRSARLHRADQHPRQHPHPRLCDPPRIRYRRGRRLQPRADRSRRAAPEEPQLLQDRQDHQRAGLGAGPRSCSMSMSRKFRPASSRFRAAIRPPAAGWPSSASSERNLLGQGQYGRFAVQYGQYARGFELSFAEPFFLGNRLGVGVDLYAKQTLATNYISYNSQTLGVGDARRICVERRAFVPGALQHLLAENHAAVPATTTVSSRRTR